MCSVKVRLLLDNEGGREVQLENGNDTTVIVVIHNETTGGLVAQNCVWANENETQSVAFGRTDQLKISVYQGQGQFLHWTCVLAIDDILGNFPLCEETEIVIESNESSDPEQQL